MSLPSQSSAARLIITSRWSADRYIALCDNDKCPWKHVSDSYIRTGVEVDKHVEGTGHSVTLHREAKCQVKAG